MDREINQGQPRRLTPEEKAIRNRKLKRKKNIRKPWKSQIRLTGEE